MATFSHMLHVVTRALQPVYELYEKLVEHDVRKEGVLPQHLGVILDGNRRYAKELGLQPGEGHRRGTETVKALIRWCRSLSIPVVTIWVFSTQNFSRSAEEVSDLMKLFVEQANAMANDQSMEEHGIRVKIIGRRDLLSEEVRAAWNRLEERTAHRSGMLLQVAIAYGGREEVVDAVKKYLETQEQKGATVAQAREQLNEQELSRYLYTAEVPDPDFIIRTSGEVRLSGFLLWQAAYSEYYFVDVHWPAFRKIDFLRAIRSYQARQRRFGA